MRADENIRCYYSTDWQQSLQTQSASKLGCDHEKTLWYLGTTGVFCIHALTLSQSKFGFQSNSMKTHKTRDVRLCHHFNWIILTAAGAPCGYYEVHSEAVMSLFNAHFLLAFFCLNQQRFLSFSLFSCSFIQRPQLL